MPDRDPPPASPGPPPAGVSRRGLFKLGGAAGAGLAALGPAAKLLAEEPEAAAPGPGEVPAEFRSTVKVTLNGEPHELELDNRATLLDTLRTKLGFTGTKKGCDHGACGACTCHVDGQRVLSCLTLAAQLDGAEVTTIEGLAPGGPDGQLHPLQEEFIACDGFQCGYCTPGQLMSGVKCIEEGHAGSEDQIREWMSGNLCRCGAYPNIVEAVGRAAARMGERTEYVTPTTGGAIQEGI